MDGRVPIMDSSVAKETIKDWATARIASRRNAPPLRFLARASRRYLEMYGNGSYAFARNGEAWLISTLAPTLETVFDVGANVGDWTHEVRQRAPKARVHSFELVPQTADGLARRFAQDPSVVVAKHGLLNRDGEVEVNFYAEHSTRSSVIDYPVGAPSERIAVPVHRGDDYCHENAVARVDLLKVDAEGSDHLVLAGFDNMFQQGLVTAVQFEYGRATILSRYLLADHYDFFQKYGMVLGKLMPDHVNFSEYHLDDEDFMGPNYVAVRADRADVIRLLSQRRL
jgi:FkbM family methyltransferase